MPKELKYINRLEITKEKSGVKKKIMMVIALIGIIVAFLLSLFVIGEPIDGKQLSYKITEDKSTLVLQVVAKESSVALREWTFENDGKNLYISARKVQVSFLFPSGEYETTVNIDEIENIYLGGRKIWCKNDGN